MASCSLLNLNVMSFYLCVLFYWVYDVMYGLKHVYMHVNNYIFSYFGYFLRRFHEERAVKEIEMNPNRTETEQNWTTLTEIKAEAERDRKWKSAVIRRE